jgi:hypothetical protein
MKTQKPHKFKMDITLKVKVYDRKTFGDYASERVKVKNIKTAEFKSLYDFYQTYFEQSCGCAHDCCGCWYSMLKDVKRTKNCIELNLYYARNF